MKECDTIVNPISETQLIGSFVCLVINLVTPLLEFSSFFLMPKKIE
jgi:hypothetical protein